jgi:hypothetical protein
MICHKRQAMWKKDKYFSGLFAWLCYIPAPLSDKIIGRNEFPAEDVFLSCDCEEKRN